MNEDDFLKEPQEPVGDISEPGTDNLMHSHSFNGYDGNPNMAGAYNTFGSNGMGMMSGMDQFGSIYSSGMGAGMFPPAAVDSNESTITAIDLDPIPVKNRTVLLWWFYSHKFIFSLIIVAIVSAFIAVGKIDQYVFGALIFGAMAAFITGKMEKFNVSSK